MQKTIHLALSTLALLATSSCSTSQSTKSSATNDNLGASLLHSLTGLNSKQQAGQSGSSVFQHLLSSVLNNAPLTHKDLLGKWTFQGSDCLFESENLLAQAGGTLAATQVESKVDGYLSKVGIVKGSCTFSFAPDGSFTATLGGRQITGTYVFDPKTSRLQLSALMGLFSLQPRVVRSGKGISLLFEADKLLALAKTVASFLGKNDTTMAIASSVMTSYKGMQLGLQLKK